jgi:hypothetical protein
LIGPSMTQGASTWSQRSDEGQGLPMAVRHLADQALSTRAAAIDRCHVGFGPGLVDEDQSCRIELVLMRLPALPPPRDVRTVLFTGAQTFF